MHYVLGLVFLKVGWLDKAIKHLTAAFKQRPAHVGICTRLAEALTKAKCIDEAIERHKWACALRSGDVSALHQLGRILLTAERNEDAIETFRKALELEPTSAHNHVWLANALMTEWKLQEALEHYCLALAIDPKNKRTLHSYGGALIECADFDEAIKQYELILDMDPKDKVALNNIDHARKTLQMIRDPSNRVTITIDTSKLPDPSNIIFVSGELDRTDDDIEPFEERVESNPHSVQAHMNLAREYCMAERFEEAVAQYKLALELEPDNAFLHVALGRAAYDACRSSAPADSFQTVADLDLRLGCQFRLRDAEEGS